MNVVLGSVEVDLPPDRVAKPLGLACMRLRRTFFVDCSVRWPSEHGWQVAKVLFALENPCFVCFLRCSEVDSESSVAFFGWFASEDSGFWRHSYQMHLTSFIFSDEGSAIDASLRMEVLP